MLSLNKEKDRDRNKDLDKCYELCSFLTRSKLIGLINENKKYNVRPYEFALGCNIHCTRKPHEIVNVYEQLVKTVGEIVIE